jgi:hypothetical protein
MFLFIKLFKRSFLKLFLLSITVLFFIGPLIWLQIHYPQQFQSLHKMLSHNSLYFTVFRWGMIGLFATFWPFFIHKIAKKNQWNAEKITFWLSQRFRLTLWLVIFEIFVCQSLTLTLIKLI